MIIDCTFNWPGISHVVGPCIRPGGSVLTERALEICSLPAGSRVADIGCGAGGTLEYIEQTGLYHMVGLDCSEILLGESVSRIASGLFVRGQSEILPFKKGSFNALFCECVLSILNCRIAALHEFARVLSEDGFLIISDVFGRDNPRQGQLEGKSQEFQTKGLFSREELLNLLTGLGFSILLWEEHERLLKEFVARMILAGECLTNLPACGQEKERKNTNRTGISYFLLVAKKTGRCH